MPAPPPPPPPPPPGKDLPEAPLKGTSKSNPGVAGLSQFGPGVSGQSVGPQVPGETGVPGDGVFGLGTNGVHGMTIGVTGCGVLGETFVGIGVSGTSNTGNGVSGTSASGNGVSGTSTGGVGIYGVGGQYAGKFDGNVLVDNGGGVTITGGNLNVTTSSGRAIMASSTDQSNDCINASSNALEHAAVSANNTAPSKGAVPSGFGLWRVRTTLPFTHGASPLDTSRAMFR
jgi:hypothetical protein